MILSPNLLHLIEISQHCSVSHHRNGRQNLKCLMAKVVLLLGWGLRLLHEEEGLPAVIRPRSPPNIELSVHALDSIPYF
jgi:hypothetical protein